MTNLITIMVVDDHPLMRKGLTQLLNLNPQFSVVAQASSGIEALHIAKQVPLSLIFLDFNMQGISGLETLKALRKHGYHGKVIVFSVSDNKQDVIAMVNHGANGYLLKDAEPETLLSNINKILAGELTVCDKLAPYLNELDQQDNIHDKLANLTRRESQILQEIATGKSNKAVSVFLDISEGTVKVHVKNVLKKLQLKSRGEATVLYLQQAK